MCDDRQSSAAATAALAVCEALLIALVEKGVLDWPEVYDALEATIEADDGPLGVGENADSREIAVNIIRSLLSRSEIRKLGD